MNSRASTSRRQCCRLKDSRFCLFGFPLNLTLWEQWQLATVLLLLLKCSASPELIFLDLHGMRVLIFPTITASFASKLHACIGCGWFIVSCLTGRFCHGPNLITSLTVHNGANVKGFQSHRIGMNTRADNHGSKWDVDPSCTSCVKTKQINFQLQRQKGQRQRPKQFNCKGKMHKRNHKCLSFQAKVKIAIGLNVSILNFAAGTCLILSGSTLFFLMGKGQNNENNVLQVRSIHHTWWSANSCDELGSPKCQSFLQIACEEQINDLLTWGRRNFSCSFLKQWPKWTIAIICC